MLWATQAQAGGNEQELNAPILAVLQHFGYAMDKRVMIGEGMGQTLLSGASLAH